MRRQIGDYLLNFNCNRKPSDTRKHPTTKIKMRRFVGTVDIKLIGVWKIILIPMRRTNIGKYCCAFGEPLENTLVTRKSLSGSLKMQALGQTAHDIGGV